MASAIHCDAVWAGDVPAIGMPWRVPDLPRGEAVASLSATRLRNDGPLSLVQLSDFALRNNPATHAAWASALADTAGIAVARAPLQPNLALSVPITVEHGAAGGGAAAATAAAPTAAARSTCATCAPAQSVGAHVSRICADRGLGIYGA